MKSANIVSRTRIKVCGITTFDDALYAAKSGADSVGFHFFPGGSCTVTAEHVAKIVQKLPLFVDKVGVFIDATVDEILSAADTASLTAIQLDGGETPEFCAELRPRLRGKYLTKAFLAGESSSAEEFAPYTGLIDAFLLRFTDQGELLRKADCSALSDVESFSLQEPCIFGGEFSLPDIVTLLERFRPWCLDIQAEKNFESERKKFQSLTRIIQVVREIDRGMFG